MTLFYHLLTKKSIRKKLSGFYQKKLSGFYRRSAKKVKKKLSAPKDCSADSAPPQRRPPHKLKIGVLTPFIGAKLGLLASFIQSQARITCSFFQSVCFFWLKARTDKQRTKNKRTDMRFLRPAYLPFYCSRRVPCIGFRLIYSPAASSVTGSLSAASVMKDTTSSGVSSVSTISTERYFPRPVPAGMSLPIMTFSLSP